MGKMKNAAGRRQMPAKKAEKDPRCRKKRNGEKKGCRQRDERTPERIHVLCPTAAAAASFSTFLILRSFSRSRR